MMRHFFLVLLTILPLCLYGQHEQPTIRTGAEELLARHDDIYDGQRIAVVANHTSLVGTAHLVDTLLARRAKVVKIFCPEHGFRGTAAAGARVDNSVDSATGLPIISLYGKNKKPAPARLADVDAVLFDLQDVGCRFYTYISTLHYVMEACAENHIPLLVLDRPNPNGHYVDGPVLDTARLRSFVGMHPVPVVYGMTIGEYARMINGEHWLAGGAECSLTVVPLQGYSHDSACCRSIVLPVPPSPNLRTPQAVALYPSLCFFEGTCVSVGRGTLHPFEVIGVPADHCLRVDYNTRFTFAGQKCWATTLIPKHFAIDLRSLDVPSRVDLSYLQAMYWLTRKGQFFLKSNFFDKLAGTADLRKQLEQGLSEEQIRTSWQPGLAEFGAIRARYLLY